MCGRPYTSEANATASIWSSRTVTSTSLPCSRIGPCSRSGSISTSMAPGSDFESAVNLTDRWRLYLRGMSYDYDWASPTLRRQGSLIDLCANAAALIDSCDQLQNFLTLLERRNTYVQSTLANNSFLDSELSLNMEWALGTKLLNLNMTKDRAIDLARSESRSIGASLLFPISYRMDLEFSLGRSESDLFEPSTYGGLFFLLYGG